MELGVLERARRKAAHMLGDRKVPIALKQSAISFTFDDFPRTAWTEGGAVLAEHGAKGTYYVSGGLCGATMDGQEQYLERDLAELKEDGHEVGCHTFDHVNALKTSSADFARSIKDNGRFFSERLDGYKPTSFAYPYGAVSLGAIKAVRQSYSSARLVVGEHNVGHIQPMLLRTATLETGRREAAGLEALIERAAAEPQWIVVMTHDVQDQPSEFGCTPEALDAALRTARQAGLRVAPVGAIMQECAIAPAAAA